MYSEIRPGDDPGSNLYSRCFPAAEEQTRCDTLAVAWGAQAGWLGCKSEPEGAVRGREWHFPFLARCKGSIPSKAVPCEGFVPFPGCGMGQRGRAAAPACLPQGFVSHKR